MSYLKLKKYYLPIIAILLCANGASMAQEIEVSADFRSKCLMYHNTKAVNMARYDSYLKAFKPEPGMVVAIEGQAQGLRNFEKKYGVVIFEFLFEVFKNQRNGIQGISERFATLRDKVTIKFDDAKNTEENGLVQARILGRVDNKPAFDIIARTHVKNPEVISYVPTVFQGPMTYKEYLTKSNIIPAGFDLDRCESQRISPMPQSGRSN